MPNIETVTSIPDVGVDLTAGAVVLTQDQDQIVMDWAAMQRIHALFGSILAHPSSRQFLNPDDVHDSAGGS